MVSQLLFGEVVEQIGKKVGWRRIRCLHDDTVGWIYDRQVIRLKRQPKAAQIVGEVSSPIFSDGLSTHVTMGASLPDYDGITARINADKFRYSGQAFDTDIITPQYTLLDKIIRRLINSPYLDGGRTPFGVDAAGLVQMVYRCIGITLPRYMDAQVQHGESVDFIETAAPGDLLFFKNEETKISHVGLLMPDRQIAHAYGHVRIDMVDHFGIYDKKRRKYTHQLRVIRRLLP